MAADFILQPDFEPEEIPKFSTIISQYENGTEQRRSKWSTPLREWNLEFKNRSATDFCCARDWYICKLGALCTFTWQNPSDSCCYTVRFKEDSLRFTLKAFCIWDFAFTLLQVK